MFGGLNGTTVQALTESWNGTSWTEVADLNVATDNGGGCGASNTSALCFGGRVPPSFAGSAKTESWNGSSWTEVNDMTLTNARGGNGTATSALNAGGPQNATNAQTWNGTNWINVNSLNSARTLASYAGVSTSGVIFGGDPGYSGLTEEWYGDGKLTDTFTTS